MRLEETKYKKTLATRGKTASGPFVFLEVKMRAKFTKYFPVWMEPEMYDLIGVAADQNLTSASTYMRCALAAALKRDGLIVQRRNKRPEKCKAEAVVAA
jgi:hypothetical protein